MSTLPFARWVPLESDALDRDILRRRQSEQVKSRQLLNIMDHGHQGVSEVKRADRCKGSCNRILYNSRRNAVEGGVRHSGRGYCRSCYVKAQRRGLLEQRPVSQ